MKEKALSYLEDRDQEELLVFTAQVEVVEERENLKPFQIAAIEGVKRRIEEVFNDLTEMYNKEINELI